MILRNEFTVASDVATVWAWMLDLERVAACVPGARIEGVSSPNGYLGAIRVRIGPMTVDYRGEALLSEVDDEARTAIIILKGREAGGQGSVRATVNNRLEATAKGTQVVTETDLQITGPQALFGKGVLEDVGGRILEEFSRRLEERIATAASGGATEHDGSETNQGDRVRGGDQRVAPAAELDLGRVLAQAIIDRTAIVAGVLIALGVVVTLVRYLRWRHR
jgi:carbon monoxide dehydrogenase subunit G